MRIWVRDCFGLCNGWVEVMVWVSGRNGESNLGLCIDSGLVQWTDIGYDEGRTVCVIISEYACIM